MAESLNPLAYSYCKQNRIFLKISDTHTTLAVSSHAGPEVVMEVQRHYKRLFRIETIDDQAFDHQLNDEYRYGMGSSQRFASQIASQDLQALAEQATSGDLLEQDSSPLINFINAVLLDAINKNASDIHIEPNDDNVNIRYRIDGLLQKVASPQSGLAPTLISRIKILAKLDIAEKRMPQDGRMTLKVAGKEIDVRVSTLPTQQTERVVLRILNKQSQLININALGLPESIDTQIRSCIKKHNGIILVTGPTGSGKTTTLYACLDHINSEDRNILTLEDPIEYQLAGIGQTQYNPKAGLTFAKGLKAILRQDPDVIMIGEIRDSETLQIAIQASLTGHLVLSTLHTNSAAGAVTRLLDMGAEPFLIRSTLRAVVAQRLARKLCPHCKVEVAKDTLNEYTSYFQQNIDRAYQPKGCQLCGESGYRGRIGIYEIISLAGEAKKLINAKTSEDSLTDHQQQLHSTMIVDGLSKVQDGLTSVEEVLRVVPANSTDETDHSFL